MHPLHEHPITRCTQLCTTLGARKTIVLDNNNSTHVVHVEIWWLGIECYGIWNWFESAIVTQAIAGKFYRGLLWRYFFILSGTMCLVMQCRSRGEASTRWGGTFLIV